MGVVLDRGKIDGAEVPCEDGLHLPQAHLGTLGQGSRSTVLPLHHDSSLTYTIFNKYALTDKAAHALISTRDRCQATRMPCCAARASQHQPHTNPLVI